jgi:asparagine synthase (glutamine-hydrolysing)
VREVKRAGFTALFGGLGSDELNAGEYEHFLPFFADLRARRLDSRLDEEVRLWIRYHDHPIFRKSRESMERDLARLTDPAVHGRCLPDRAGSSAMPMLSSPPILTCALSSR